MRTTVGLLGGHGADRDPIQVSFNLKGAKTLPAREEYVDMLVSRCRGNCSHEWCEVWRDDVPLSNVAEATRRALGNGFRVFIDGEEVHDVA